ncbi:MAG: hypothetical protein ACTSUA_04050 [Candidatus Heimdallarchaeota archaeon]
MTLNSKEKHRQAIYERVLKEDGVPACEKVFACNAVCPKGVQPGTTIDSVWKIEKKKQ